MVIVDQVVVQIEVTITTSTTTMLMSEHGGAIPTPGSRIPVPEATKSPAPLTGKCLCLLISIVLWVEELFIP